MRRFSKYDKVRNNFYTTARDTFSLEDNIMEFFEILSLLIIIEGVLLVILLHGRNSIEDIERKELQKLVDEIAD